MCNNIICGGFSKNPEVVGFDRSCVKWDEEATKFIKLDVKLIKPRDNIVCWGLQSGDVLLFGGHDSGDNISATERVFKNVSSSEIAFSLKINHHKIE